MVRGFLYEGGFSPRSDALSWLISLSFARRYSQTPLIPWIHTSRNRDPYTIIVPHIFWQLLNPIYTIIEAGNTQFMVRAIHREGGVRLYFITVSSELRLCPINNLYALRSDPIDKVMANPELLPGPHPL